MADGLIKSESNSASPSLVRRIAKATGDGLVMAIDRRDRFPETPAEGSWTQHGDGALWHFVYYALGDDYSLAIACRPERPGDVRLRWVGKERPGWAI